ncbi:MAG TPA: TetR/AcrR family transcriptional regulator [Candidatus Tumulicola sp.]|jgi:AcrR family transcriptional regulator
MSALADSRNSREAILDAAEIAFAQRGFDGTTISDICAEAEVSRGLPSYLFGSKDALYRAVVGRAAQDLRSTVSEPLRRCAKKGSLENVLGFCIQTYLEYLERNPRVVRLLQWEMLAAGSEMSPNSQPFAPSSELFGELLAILEPVFLRNRRSRLDARNALSSIVSLCFFPFMSGFATQTFGAASVHSLDVRKRSHAIARLLFRGILS